MFSKSNFVFYIIILLLVCLLCLDRRQTPSSERVVYRDSVVRDTVCETVTLPRELIVREHRDTLWQRDTIYTPVYFTQLEYKTDRYKIVVEGFRPKLLSVETYPITHYLTVERVVEKVTPVRRVSSGVNVGAGLFYGTKGLDVGFYVGYGVTVKF